MTNQIFRIRNHGFININIPKTSYKKTLHWLASFMKIKMQYLFLKTKEWGSTII